MSRKAGRDKTGKRSKVTMLVMWDKRVESRIDRAGWYDCSKLLMVEWLQSEGLKPVEGVTEEGNSFVGVIFKRGFEIWA